MKRRSVTPFSLSFLDIMFCGFGAVVLLVLILNADTVKKRNEIFSDLRAEVIRFENEVIVGKENLVRARNSLQVTEQNLVIMQGEASKVIDSIQKIEAGKTDLEKKTSASRKHINQLKSDLKGLDSETSKLGAEKDTREEQGKKIHAFSGEGDRQYLTGLKLGGKRILLLVDASASMLAETVVNVIRRRNMNDASKRSSPKWKRAQASAVWLISNLPANVQFQVYAFNTKAGPVLQGRPGWLSTSDQNTVASVVKGLMKRVPEGGTSLYHALDAARQLKPRPDNILLITDGLPTQGKARPSSTTVTAEQRLGHFERAIKTLPSGIPVNTILMPMEGDVYAAAAFWKLAVDTKGSFLTPARDWP